MFAHIRDEWRSYIPHLFIVALILLYGVKRFLFPSTHPLIESSIQEEEWEETTVSSEASIDVSEEPTSLIVDVKGAVQRPGLYELEEGMRIYDAIEQAGGLTDDADDRALALAERVSDEMSIYVPRLGEVQYDPLSIGTSSSPTAASTSVNINRADANELTQLPGIGPKKAEAIVEYREMNGPFTTVEQLMDVSGIGPKTFETLQPHITVK